MKKPIRQIIISEKFEHPEAVERYMALMNDIVDRVVYVSNISGNPPAIIKASAGKACVCNYV